MNDAGGLAEVIDQYAKRWPAEDEVAARYKSLLEHPEAFLRTHLPGHITGSAFIVDRELTHTLLVHHAKLNRWLQPGGHADGETDIANVARREANEETGVTGLDLLSLSVFDLDIHPIPSRSDFPAHDHYDVRYLFQASKDEPVIVSEESHDVRWVRLAELERFNREPSLLRLREKLTGIL
jgi:8-oxo-dGTP pyrophosphatase MutT (NUDIX family)